MYFLSVFVFKLPLLPCMYDSIRFGPIRYYTYSNQNPIAPLWQHRSGKLRAELLLHILLSFFLF